MNTVVYRVFEHDGAWTYQVGDACSMIFPSRELARAAAEQAACSEGDAGEEGAVSFEDGGGISRIELFRRDDRHEADL
jgi:hypothetical protein